MEPNESAGKGTWKRILGYVLFAIVIVLLVIFVWPFGTLGHKAREARAARKVAGVSATQVALNQETAELQQLINVKSAFRTWLLSSQGKLAASLCSYNSEYNKARLDEDVCVASAYLRCMSFTKEPAYYAQCAGGALTVAQVNEAKVLIGRSTETLGGKIDNAKNQIVNLLNPKKPVSPASGTKSSGRQVARISRPAASGGKIARNDDSGNFFFNTPTAPRRKAHGAAAAQTVSTPETVKTQQAATDLSNVPKPDLDGALAIAFASYSTAYDAEDFKGECAALAVIMPHRDYISKKVAAKTASLTKKQWTYMQDRHSVCRRENKSELAKGLGGIWDFAFREPACDVGVLGKLGFIKSQKGRACDKISAYGFISGATRLAFTWEVAKNIQQELRHEKSYPAANQPPNNGGGTTALCPNGKGGASPCNPDDGTVSSTTGAVDPMTPNNQIQGVSADIPITGAGSSYTGTFTWNENAPAKSPQGSTAVQTSGVDNTPNDGLKLPDEAQTFQWKADDDGGVKMPSEPSTTFKL